MWVWRGFVEACGRGGRVLRRAVERPARGLAGRGPGRVQRAGRRRQRPGGRVLRGPQGAGGQGREEGRRRGQEGGGDEQRREVPGVGAGGREWSGQAGESVRAERLSVLRVQGGLRRRGRRQVPGRVRRVPTGVRERQEGQEELLLSLVELVSQCIVPNLRVLIG